MGQVTIWYMTEAERLAYIEKHPIVPTKKTSKKVDKDFANIQQDYKWRGKKAAASRWGK